MATQLEWRTPKGVEVRALPDSRTVGGTGIPYEQRSVLFNGGYEVIDHRALNKTLGDHLNVMALHEHDYGKVLGSTDSNTLRLKNTERGLDFEVDIPKSREDVLEAVQRRDLKHASWGMTVREDSWEPHGGTMMRRVHSLQLHEMSIVARPVYDTTAVSVRSLAAYLGEDPDEVESLYRSGELSKMWRRTDQALSAPTPLDVRGQGLDIELARRRSESQARKIQMDTGHRPGEPKTLDERLIALRLRRNQWYAPVEARSLDAYQVNMLSAAMRH